MNNKISFVAILMAVLCMMTSCLSDDSSSTIYYDDVAITSFSLGTLKKIVYTKHNGNDSTYTTTASCSSVQFTIDNVNNKIYNVDSLTRGIVTSKALVSVSTKNSGYAYLKSLTSDSLTYISSTDSLDFSQPRIIRVVASDGSWYKDYTVDVRVHKEVKDSVYWTEKTVSSSLKEMQNMKALCFRGNMIVYGTSKNDGAFAAYTSSIDDGSSWVEMPAPFTAQTTMVTDSTTLYAYSAGKVYSSTDNATWTEKSTNNDIRTLAVATKEALYAVANDGQILVSADGGASWTNDAMDDNKSLMPVSDIQGFASVTNTNDDITALNIFGNTGVDADSTAVHWSKIVDNSNNSYTQPWQYNEIAYDTYHSMPALTNMNIIPYAGGLMMIGGDGRGACTEEAFAKFYLSKDNGLTWWKDSRFYFPLYFASDKDNFAFAVDSANYMWIICGGSGQVWKGRLTQMTWTNN